MIAKTTITMLLVGLVPLAIFGAISLSQQEKRIRAEASIAMQHNAQQISGQVDEWFDKNVRALQTAASLPAITSMQREDQAKVLAAVKKAYPWMYLVFTVAPSGANVARSDDQPLTDYSERQYFKDVIATGKELSWETLIGKSSKKPALVVAVPIKANGAVVGVLAAAMNIEDISRIVANWKSGKTGFAFLVDEQAKVIAHPRDEFVLAQRRLQEHPLIAGFRTSGQGQLATFTDDGNEAIGYVQGNANRWALVVQQSTDEVFAPLRQTVTLGLVLLVCAGVLVTVIAVLSSKMLVRPIVEMTYAADRMSMGELEAPIPSAGKDELGMLATALERLRKSRNAAIARM
jgi:methyl-accepting chemotaxis protein